VRASTKGLSTRNVFCIGPMVICACGLLPNPAKVSNFQYRAWLCSVDQKFHGDDEKTRKSQFWDSTQRPTAIIRPKCWILNIRHDGILSIRNFTLMIKNHFVLFQHSGNWWTTKKRAPYFRGNTNFKQIHTNEIFTIQTNKFCWKLNVDETIKNMKRYKVYFFARNYSFFVIPCILKNSVKIVSFTCLEILKRKIKKNNWI
jgi:hypothetical protein